jgi:2-oxoglutarate dehydrogenase complex dehydrogenase (E1) component-like enzyme
LAVSGCAPTHAAKSRFARRRKVSNKTNNQQSLFQLLARHKKLSNNTRRNVHRSFRALSSITAPESKERPTKSARSKTKEAEKKIFFKQTQIRKQRPRPVMPNPELIAKFSRFFFFFQKNWKLYLRLNVNLKFSTSPT